jgi:hypothetical protein
MSEGTTVFEKDMKVSEIKHTETEKNKKQTEEVKVILEGEDVTLTLKKPGDSLKQFVDGEDVLVTITQPQTELDKY